MTEAHAEIAWTPDCQSFDTLKTLMTIAPVLSYLDFTPEFVNWKYLIIHSPQGFSGVIYTTGWGTLPDCLGAVYK